MSERDKRVKAFEKLMSGGMSSTDVFFLKNRQMFKYIKSRFKALSPSDGLSSTISGLKQINRIIKRIIKNG